MTYKLPLHFNELLLNVSVALGQVTHMAQDMSALFPLVCSSQPTRRLVHEEHANEEQEGGKTLHGERDLPGRVASVVERHAIIDPESHHGADLKRRHGG